MTDSKDDELANVILDGPYKAKAPRPTSWADFTVEKLQTTRPVAPSTIQNERARCELHKHSQDKAVTRYSVKHGYVARVTYFQCHCVEYRPVKSKVATSGGNWIVNRNS